MPPPFFTLDTLNVILMQAVPFSLLALTSYWYIIEERQQDLKRSELSKFQRLELSED